jgi:hypothetical protein
MRYLRDKTPAAKCANVQPTAQSLSIATAVLAGLVRSLQTAAKAAAAAAVRGSGCCQICGSLVVVLLLLLLLLLLGWRLVRGWMLRLLLLLAALCGHSG